MGHDTRTIPLYEYWFDENGKFRSRTSDASVQRGREPERDVFWFFKAGNRACIARKYLDKPRYGRYYSLRECPQEAERAILRALEGRRVMLRTQLTAIEDTLRTIETAKAEDT